MDSRALRSSPALIGPIGRRNAARASTTSAAEDANGAAAASGYTRDVGLSFGPPPVAPDDAESRLYLADNLPVMRALVREVGPCFKLAYLDPPYNTGRSFAEYEDACSREEWLSRMRPRVVAIRELLREDGALVAQIGDTELGALLVLLDDVFGAKNRVSTITLVRSAATGHKAKNRGPVNVTDFLLLYAKDRTRFAPTALYKRRVGIDAAYRTFVENPDSAPRDFVFAPLGKAAARALGHETSRAARSALGGRAWDEHTCHFARENARHVVRFAQVRFEAVSRDAQRLVVASRATPGQVLTLARKGVPDLLLRDGNRILFLASKMRSLASDGTVDVAASSPTVLCEPLTNVWDDIPFQGIAREGGVVFVRNKKPERLLQRIVALTTSVGDWVLDPYLGSGTTAAVASTMNRKWIGIECGNHGQTLAIPRLERVCSGADRTGIRRDAPCSPKGGFGVYR